MVWEPSHVGYRWGYALANMVAVLFFAVLIPLIVNELSNKKRSRLRLVRMSAIVLAVGTVFVYFAAGISTHRLHYDVPIASSPQVAALHPTYIEEYMVYYAQGDCRLGRHVIFKGGTWILDPDVQPYVLNGTIGDDGRPVCRK